MDVSHADTSEPRARQLRDEPQSVRYPTRGYQQRQPSLERGVADQTDLKNDEHGKERAHKRTHEGAEVGRVCSLDKRQPYQRWRSAVSARFCIGVSRLERMLGTNHSVIVSVVREHAVADPRFATVGDAAA